MISQQQHQPMPVSGYTTQPQEAIDIVNCNKRIEEDILRMLDAYKENPNIDQRWVAISRTHIEQGFMAMNRSIFKPTRIDLE